MTTALSQVLSCGSKVFSPTELASISKIEEYGSGVDFHEVFERFDDYIPSNVSSPITLHRLYLEDRHQRQSRPAVSCHGLRHDKTLPLIMTAKHMELEDKIMNSQPSSEHLSEPLSDSESENEQQAEFGYEELREIGRAKGYDEEEIQEAFSYLLNHDYLLFIGSPLVGKR